MALNTVMASLSLGAGSQQPVVRTTKQSHAPAHFCARTCALLTGSHSSVPLFVCAQTLRSFEGFRAAGAARPAQLVAARSRQVRCWPGCPCRRARTPSGVLLDACTQRPVWAVALCKQRWTGNKA